MGDKLKEKEEEAHTNVAKAQASLKDQMAEAHKAGLVTAKEMHEKLGELGVAVPKPVEIELSFADAGAYGLRQATLKKKLSTMGLELGELEKPETAVKNAQGEFIPEAIEDKHDFTSK